MKFELLFFTLIASYHSIASSKSFTGSTCKPKCVMMDLSGPIILYREKENSLKIVVGKNAAFYNFPKRKDATEVRQFLDSHVKSKKKIKITVDAVTRDVISLEETP